MPYEFVPAQAASFSLELGKLGTTYITEIAGIDQENEVIERKIGGQPEQLIKMPGNTTGGDVTLKRGVDSNLNFSDWFKKVRNGDIAGARENGSIYALDPTGAVMAEWVITEAWPSKLTISGFKTDSDEVVTEELTVVYESVKRVK